MTDLRELLYEPWCPTCSAPVSSLCRPQAASSGHLQEKPPLATRMPEAVPAGLSTFRGGWRIYGEGEDDVCCITDEQAVTQFIGNAVEVLDIGYMVIAGEGELATRLTAALHRLADKRDAAASSGLHQGDSGVD